MRINVVFDKIASQKRIHAGWGVSFLVENRILFDAGENGSWLLDNMETLKIDIDKIEQIVISHDHWDHTDGLWMLLEKKKNIKVYACPNFGLYFKNKVKKAKSILKESKNFTEISKNIFVTGEIFGEYNESYIPEQALVTNTGKGISVITGCAHPGIVKILHKVKEYFSNKNIYTVIGGFHLMNKNDKFIEAIAKEFKKIGVKRVGATHCSGLNAEKIFKSNFKENFLPIKIGKEIII